MTSNLKINILSEIKETPWGGGNQFLKSLRQKFIDKKIYDSSPESADIIIFDSYQNIIPALYLKRRHPQKYLIYRLGPIFHLHRGHRWKFLDYLISSVANHTDWIVFQSEWSKKEFNKLGFSKKNFSVIKNAPNPQFFNSKNILNSANPKIKLISYSWSQNPNKGFSFLEFLDKNLDFSKYQFTFIGNSPIKFKNIIQKEPLNSQELSEELKKSDIFISGSKDDACSNSIIEALACHLPVIALNSGGNPELVKKNGELFNSPEELLEKINSISNKLNQYNFQEETENIDSVSQKYLNSIEEARKNPPFQISLFFIIKIKFLLFLFNLYRKI